MVKRLEWTDELVGKFWDGFADTPLAEQINFAGSSANAIADLAANFIPHDARCLDFGGGNGELCEELLGRGYRAGIFEPSDGRGTRAHHCLDGRPGFLGLNPTGDVQPYDAVFCLEVYEHVPEPVLPAFLGQLSELLRPGGTLLLTTPNQEDLDANGVYCPTCDSYFHRWQHVRSVDPESLLNKFAPYGFECAWLGLIGFEAPHEVERFAQGGMRAALWRRVARWARDGLGLPLPGEPKPILAGQRSIDITLGSQSNIVYVGKRLGEEVQP